MKEDKKKKSYIGKVIYLIILICLIWVLCEIYNKYQVNNFNDFIRTEYKPYTSEFVRDNEVKYGDKNSYKISSKEENDAMFYKEIKVTPNIPYKVTCMVKTEDVKTTKEVSDSGAHISIADTVEKSKSITGTNDWQKLEFIFNSKNRNIVKLGFRLGGYEDNCIGTAWFSDFKIEVGAGNTDTNWNVACFVITNTKVNINNKEISLSMSDDEISLMRQNMSRFKSSCEELSNRKMSVTYDFIKIDEPLTTLSYDEENGYHADAKDVKKLIDIYLQKENYDHIFVCIKLGDNTHPNDIPVYDWIGLGGMDYLGIGFSNIRLPNSNKSYTYRYDARVNTFPEEVFIHEFLHSLERISKEYGYDRPNLHDYAKYGYKDEKLIGLKKWYQDYMNSEIKTNSGNIGLNKEIYSLKPNNQENFKFTYTLNKFNEPQNIIEEIKAIITKAINNLSMYNVGNTL